MRRRPDPTCPVAGTPCVVVLDDLYAEMARLRARYDGRPGVPCGNCQERSLIALAGLPRCYGCRIRPVEGDHVRASGSGPAIRKASANLNRIAMEGERIWHSIGREDLCRQCVFGFGLRIGIDLGRMQVDL